MGRAKAPQARAKLLEAIVDYILNEGLVGLRLRPLAAALKTSPRMLLYFFGSKERLITEALVQSWMRQQQELASMLATKGDRHQRLALAWEVWSSKESERSLWLFFEVLALTMRDRKRFPGLLERLVKDWLPFCEQVVAAVGVERKRISPLATFIMATIRGLQLDMLATGERARIDGAFREMLGLLSLQRPRVGRDVRQRSHGKKRRMILEARSRLTQL